MDLEEAKKMMEAHGFVANETSEPEKETVAEATISNEIAPDNGYYELYGCRCNKLGSVETFNNGQSMKQTITFSYKTRKGQEVSVCCEAWNDQLNHNDFQIGAYYDITLRIGCRTTKDNRDFPTVSLAYAHRLRTITLV